MSDTKVSTANFSVNKRLMTKTRKRAIKTNYNLENGSFFHPKKFYSSKYIAHLLHQLGIPSHIRGHRYLCEGIHLVCDHENTIFSMTKEMYPKIAGKFDTTATGVEKAIRYAIEISCLRADLELMEEIFGNSINLDKAKPTNSEFVITIANKIRFDE